MLVLTVFKLYTTEALVVRIISCKQIQWSLDQPSKDSYLPGSIRAIPHLRAMGYAEKRLNRNKQRANEKNGVFCFSHWQEHDLSMRKRPRVFVWCLYMYLRNSHTLVLSVYRVVHGISVLWHAATISQRSASTRLSLSTKFLKITKTQIECVYLLLNKLILRSNVLWQCGRVHMPGDNGIMPHPVPQLYDSPMVYVCCNSAACTYLHIKAAARSHTKVVHNSPLELRPFRCQACVQRWVCQLVQFAGIFLLDCQSLSRKTPQSLSSERREEK